jgi:hypothetical protein
LPWLSHPGISTQRPCDMTIALLLLLLLLLLQSSA